jgi:hypothetical protein
VLILGNGTSYAHGCDHWLIAVCHIGRIKLMEAFHHPPAVIFTSGTCRRLIIDLLKAILADIPDVEIAIPDRREAPWMPANAQISGR